MRFALELHAHSWFSHDSLMDPVRIARRARAVGLSGVAIVDHDSMAGSRAAAECASDAFLVIPGMEISTDSGDIIALFLREEVRLRDPVGAVAAVHAQGGLAILAHPFLQLADYPDALLRAVDAVETVNPKAACSPWFRRAEDRRREMCERFRLPAVGGSDAHTYAEVGAIRNLVPSLDPEAVREAIRRGAVSVTGKPWSAGTYRALVSSIAVGRIPLRVKERLWPKGTYRRAPRGSA